MHLQGFAVCGTAREAAAIRHLHGDATLARLHRRE